VGIQAALSPAALGGALVLSALASCGTEPKPLPVASPSPTSPPQPTSPVQPAPTEAPRSALPERAAIAGVPGFRIVCGIHFRAAPADPHQLEIVQVFPARAYWRISRPSSGGLDRAIDLLAGPEAWHLEPGAQTARAQDPAARADLELRSHLRSALILWPEGFAWQPDPNRPGFQIAEIAALGRLVARCAPGEAPVLMRAERSAGSVVEELRELRWKTHEGRSWPAQAELWVADEHVWTEQLETATTEVSFQDAFFQPRQPVVPQAAPLSPAEVER